MGMTDQAEFPDENALVALHGFQPQGKERRRLKRSLKLLPNIFTLGNAFFGFCAIVLAANKNAPAAAYCILIGACMDSLDGRIARLTNSSSPLGMQLDSLSDAITFCLAPACMMYLCDFSDSNGFVFIGSAFYLLAGVFRLARFNVTSQAQSNYFIGLPSTIAGCCIAAGVLAFPLQEHSYLIAPMLVILGYLMVSRWRFPTFKQTSKRRIFTSLMVAVVIAITFDFHRTFFAFGTAYFILGLVTTVRHKLARLTLHQ